MARVLLRAFSGFIVVLVLINFICLPIGAGESGTEKNIRLFLRAIEGDEDILVVTVGLGSERGICALLCSLEYNPESLIYLSGGACDGSLNFKAVDFGGNVRFLLDSTENSTARGELVILYFKRIGSGRTGLSLGCQDEALYYAENSDILSVKVEIDSNLNSTDVDCSGGGEEKKAPEIIRAERNGGAVFFSVRADRACFAAGARLFFVDIGGGGKHFEMILAGVVGTEGLFCGNYLLDTETSYAVIVTAVGYRRNEIVTGEKITLVRASPD